MVLVEVELACFEDLFLLFLILHATFLVGFPHLFILVEELIADPVLDIDDAFVVAR